MEHRTDRTRRRILIEGQNLALASGTGIATYARQLAAASRRLGHETGLLVGTRRSVARGRVDLAEPGLFEPVGKPTLRSKIEHEVRKLTVLPTAIKAARVSPTASISETGTHADRFHGFSEIHLVPHLSYREFDGFRRYGRMIDVDVEGRWDLFHTTRPTPIRVRRCANVYTLHDLVPLRLPHTTLDDKKLYIDMIRALCRSADHIVTVSEFSRRDIIALTGIDENRITNCHQAVTIPEALLERDLSSIGHEIETRFGLTFGQYFLFVGALEPKKNVLRLIDAYAASGVKRPLIIAGGEGWMNERESQAIEGERFLSYQFKGGVLTAERSVRRLPYLPLDQLVSLIRGARALLFPSVYEGFGLPVAEAMLLGTPTMTSNVTSLPEIAADAALLVDPYDVDAMAKAIRTLDADDDLCRELSAKGRVRAEAFSPQRYESLLDELFHRLM